MRDPSRTPPTSYQVALIENDFIAARVLSVFF
jgi:hypothetical protein